MGKDKEKTCFVIDTNVLIAALINPSSPVWSILDIKDIDFFVPEFSLVELGEYKGLIKEKTGEEGETRTVRLLNQRTLQEHHHRP